jgi:hypothetical protein
LALLDCPIGLAQDGLAEMTLGAGKQEYVLGDVPVSAVAISWTEDELNSGIADPISATVFDDAGHADIAGLLDSIVSTDFDGTELKKSLSTPTEPESWRVGEAIAETYLVQHRQCQFPWPDGRDSRKSGSSLPGADLVGFRHDGHSHAFAFGEVKTSSENKYPPGAMYGSTGLKQQLEDLRDVESIRVDLVRYLAFRAKDVPWKTAFIEAVQRYSENKADIAVYGILVRDVTPHLDDLRARMTALGISPPHGMNIELIAIYLPTGCIPALGKKILAAHLGNVS